MRKLIFNIITSFSIVSQIFFRSSINIDIFPARVQGTGAEYTIEEGLEYFSNSDVDVVVVARGGGSLEDLQPF